MNSGAYLWNSGMFLFSARRLPAGAAGPRAGHRALPRRAALVAAARRDLGLHARCQRTASAACRKESIDYAVMEKTSRRRRRAAGRRAGATSAPGPRCSTSMTGTPRATCWRATWSPWTAPIPTSGPRAGWSPSWASTAALVVETKDAVLVVPKARAQDVKKIVEELERQGRPETSLGREVFRPWGSYDSLDSGAPLPGEAPHRAARRRAVPADASPPRRALDRGRRARPASPATTRSSTWARTSTPSFPLGAKHRIENPGTITLRIIEVQVGDYLGEDDIVRFEDRYGRQGPDGLNPMPPLSCFKAYDIRGRVPTS